MKKIDELNIYNIKKIYNILNMNFIRDKIEGV